MKKRTSFLHFLKDYALFSNFAKGAEDGKRHRDRILVCASLYAILLNVILSLVKVILFITTSSISILADAVNNLTDSVSSIIFLVGTKLSLKEADEEHPYGHGRIEYVSSLIISFIVLMMGIGFIKFSIDKILHPEQLKVSQLSLSLMFLSLFVKIYMGIFFAKLSAAFNSLPSKAQSRDYFGDALITAGIVFSLFAYKFFGLMIDSYLGIAISLYIIFMALILIRDTLVHMIGAYPKALMDQVLDRISRYEEIEKISKVVVADYGPNTVYISCNVGIDSAKSLLETHAILERIEREIMHEFSCVLTLRAEPVDR